MAPKNLTSGAGQGGVQGPPWTQSVKLSKPTPKCGVFQHGVVQGCATWSICSVITYKIQILIRSQLHALLWTLFHKLNNPLPYLVQQVLGSLRPVIIAMLQVWSIIPAFDARSIQQPLLLTFFVRCVGYREG